jgi:hypothetical protein
MSSRLEQLAARRERLVAQSDALRARLGGTTEGVEQVLRIADLGVAAGRYVKARPLLSWLTIGAVVLIVKPRRALRGVSYAVTALSVVGQIRQILSALR